MKVDRQKRKYRLRKITRASLKHVRLAVHGSLNIHGGSLDVGEDRVVNVYGNMTITDVNAVLPKNVCLCETKDQAISTPPALPWQMDTRMVEAAIKDASRIYKKFSKKSGKKRGRKKIR